MFSKRIFYFVLIFISCLGLSSGALAAVKSKGEACQILKGMALKKHLAATNESSGEYTCENYSEDVAYYVFGLHFKLKHPSNKPQSNLVGWFAVGKSDGAVYEWDMANLRLGRPLGDPSSTKR